MTSTTASEAGSRLPPPFAERPAGAQLAGAVVVPAVFGAVCGLVAGWSAPVYWALQVLAVIGGVLGGLEHHGGWAGADRGLTGGLVFGSFVLLAHAISGASLEVSLGEPPASLVVVAGLISCGLGAIGGAQRARLERQAT